MKLPKLVDDTYLFEISQKIYVLPPDEAATLLFKGSALVLFAGYPDIAYQLFTKFFEEELKISEESSLANPIKSIIPSLCYLMGIACPAIFSMEEMSVSQLEQLILKNSYQYEQIANIDRWFQVALPSGDWSEDFLFEITHPKIDVTGNEKFKVYSFLQDLHRIIAVRCLSRKRFQEASHLLDIFEEVVNAWKLECLTYIEQEIIIFGIRTHFKLNNYYKADKFILKWWHSSDSLISDLYLLSYLPPLMKRVSEGVLQDELKISRTQAQEFLASVSVSNYNSQQIGFMPSVEDWKNFLEKWNEKIFNNIDDEYLENYKLRYPEALEYRQCLRNGATEAQIIQLEDKLQTKLPVSYKNFLLANNGFLIFNEDCELYGTEQIAWFIDENRDWAECWDDNDDVSDEKYFQYGEHQDCIWVRGRYIKTALQISSTEDGYVYLLNPQIIDNRNEWEAWDFGSKLPGANRYRSFWDMMQQVYKRSFGI